MSVSEKLLVQRDLALDALAVQVAGALGEQGIACLLLKGISIGSWLYAEQQAARHYSDVDVLVPPEDYRTAGEVLAGLGFADPVAEVRETEGQSNARAWRRGDGLTVDLHHGLIGVCVPDTVSWRVLWESSSVITIAGRDVRVLGHGARALHVALHVAQHGREHLPPVRDLERCLSLVAGSEWEQAARIATELGARAALSAGLRVVEEGRALADRLGLSEDLPLEVALRAQSAPPLALGFARLSDQATWANRASYVGRKIFPSPAYLRDWHPVGSRGRWGLVAANLHRVAWLVGHAPEAARIWYRAQDSSAADSRAADRRAVDGRAADGRTVDRDRRPTGPTVLRAYHSAVVPAWRERDRQLRAEDVDVRLLTARTWGEGGARVHFSSQGDRFAKAVLTLGRHVNIFVFNPLPAWRLIRSRPDIIDIHEEPCSLATGELLLLRKLAGNHGKVVVYSAQNIMKHYPLPFRWIESWALRTATAIYACAGDTVEVIREKGYQGPVEVIPLGVDRSQFAPDPAARANPRLTAGFVGRLERKKGVFVALDAVAREPSWDLTFVGDGPAREELERRIPEEGLEQRISCLGYLSHDALPSFYRGLDVLVVPSISTEQWKEQFGRVVIEAMACGCPVIGTDSGALREVIGDPEMIVPEGDVEALAALLHRLGEDAGERLRLASEARERSRQWDWAEIARLHRMLYDLALAPR